MSEEERTPNEGGDSNNDAAPGGMSSSEGGSALSALSRRGRFALIGGAAAALLLIVWGLAAALRPAPETLDGFIERWNGVVEAETADEMEEGYEKLLLESTVSRGSSAWMNGMDLLTSLRGPEGGALALSPEAGGAEYPSTIAADQQIDSLDENAGSVSAAAPDGAEYRLDLRRGGWSRQWRISNVIASAEAPEETVEYAEIPAPGETAIEAPGEENGEAVGTGETPIDTQLKLSQILEAWRAAWERKDVDNYIKWYAEFAEITRVTVTQGKEIPETLNVGDLRRRMSRLAQQYSEIQVGIKNVRIEGDRAEADVSFHQTYRSYRPANGSSGQNAPAYSDQGRKTLKFVVDESGEWRIYHENWTTYIDVPSFPLD